jgi:plastocyanin
MHRFAATRRAILIAFCAWASIVGSGARSARADVLIDEAELISAPGVAPGSEYSFTLTEAQALTVTLVDNQAPAAFQSLQIAVTLGDTLVGSASVDAATHQATVAIPGAVGTYILHVIGTPTNLGFGSFGSFDVCTAPQSSPTACIAADSYSDNIQAPSTISTSGQSTLSTTFTTKVAGTYTVTFTDDAFPAALASAVAGIAQGSIPIAGPISPGGAPTAVTLAANTSYSLLVGANADATLLAGLYSIQVKAPDGTTVFARTLPVGELASSTVVSNPAAQSLTLTLADLSYPSALAGIGAAVTAGADLLGALTRSGTAAIAAPAGNLEVWQYAIAGASPGTYRIGLGNATTSLLANSQVVSPANTPATASYAFTVEIPAAGTYNLAVTDFQFPATLQTLTPTVAQNGTVIPADSGGNFTAAQGTVLVVVAASAAPGTLGLFSVEVTGTGTNAATRYLDQTQSVGGVFSSREITLGTSDTFAVALTDLGFPGAFTDLAVAVSQNGKLVGRVFGSSNFTLNATPGNYVFSFVVTPGALNYGLFGISAVSTAPTVSFSSNATSVTAGQSVELSWTSANATSCTAGGASEWSGNVPISSTGTAVAIAKTSTLTLSCTGPGGAVTQSLSITATTPATKSSSSGGGALDPACLFALAIVLGGGVLRGGRHAMAAQSAADMRSRTGRRTTA